jgi:signal transduction histidine kinase/ligand-binding sensor domain-containing protein
MFQFRSFLTLFFLPLSLCSQTNYIFQHLTVEDGLLSNPRVNAFQDAQGFYWFSSVNGIQRFDGKTFISYLYPDNGTKNSLAEWAGKPIEDKENNIWIVNEEGIEIYSRIEHTLSRIYMSDATDSNTNNVCAIIKDEKNMIWEITSRNIFLYNYASKKSILRCNIFNDVHDYILKVAYDPKRNNFWMLISRNGSFEIASFDYKKNEISYLNNNMNIRESLPKYMPVAFFNIDHGNNLWIADYSGNLCKYNTIKNKLSTYPIYPDKENKDKTLSSYIIQDFLDDDNGSIWFGGESSGLMKYEKNADRFIKIKFENGSQYGLHYDQTIYSFFKDREGNIWIDTDLGMNIFNPGLQQFKYIDQKSSASLAFNANVTSIFESSIKEIWISTFGNGIFKYDSNFILRENYVHNRVKPASLGEPLNRIWSFGEDNKKRIWIGSQSGMLSIFTPSTGRFANKIIPEFNHSTIMHMSGDKNNNFWFGLYNGMLGRCNSDSGKIYVFKYPYSNNFKEATIIDGLMTDSNKVYVATSMNGLNRYDIQRSEMDEKIIFPQHVFAPGALNDSIIMGGTAGKGIFLFNKLSKSTHFFNTQNGLSSNIVYGALPASFNNVWIFANNGIDRLNLSDGQIFHYTSDDGIKDHVFLKAFCRLKNGFFLVAANSGIIYFNPDSIRARPPPPDVIITSFSDDQRHYSVDSLLQHKTIELAYSQNAISIEYASVSFTGRKTDQYLYQLNGIDRNWVAAGAHRSVEYANLAPGNYTFKVKAHNGDGTETLHTTTLSFTIFPPWWGTSWAYLLWFALASGIIYAVLENRNRSRHALSDVRQSIATDLHDDIGSTLNSISVYSEIAGRDLETNLQNSRLLLQKMGSASRNMIDTMNDIVWAINPKNDNFDNILLRMQYFAGELLSGKNILLQFDVDEKAKSVRLPIKKRKNFYLIFKEGINNAYKYADCKMVNVSIAHQGQYIIMIITDDGKGFEIGNKTSGGNGLANIQTRSKEIGAQVTLTSWLMKGTRIEVQLPI